MAPKMTIHTRAIGNRTGKWATILLGIALPFLIVSLIRSEYSSDIEIFIRWADCLRHGDGALYKIANYPVVGAIASGGAIEAIRSVFHVTAHTDLRRIFHFYLALFDALQFVLMGVLAGRIGARRPWAIALLIVALPSTWAGGSVWGQIDGITQVFFLCAILACDACLASTSRRHFAGAQLAFGLGLTSCGLAMLTKQLSVFSLPWLFLAVFVCALQIRGEWGRKGLLAAAPISAFVGGTLMLADRALTVPRGFGGSSFLFAWFGGGSEHARVISVNGFNLWTLLERDPLSSSTAPFAIPHTGMGQLVLAPKQCGEALFVGLTLVLLWLLVRLQDPVASLARLGRAWSPPERHMWTTSLLFVIGIENLLANVVLAGTHERYLYHAYPFLLLGGLCLWEMHRLGWRPLAAIAAGAVFYGVFVFSLIGQIPGFLFFARRIEIIAVLHVVLLVVLLGQLWSRTKGPVGQVQE